MPTAEFDCPYCHQHFAIKRSILKRKKGYVLCVHCKHHFISNQPLEEAQLFDDQSGLADDEPVYSVPAANELTTEPYVFDYLDTLDDLADPAPNQDPTAVFADAARATQELRDESWAHKLIADEETNTVTQHEPAPAVKTRDFALVMDDKQAPNVIDKANMPAYMQKVDQRLNAHPKPQPTKSSSLGWTLGSGLLVLLLVGQYAMFNLNQMMKQPSIAELITNVCNVIPIDCHLPRAEANWATFQVLDVTGNARYTDVIFHLTNSGSEPLLYPDLVITLRQGNKVKAQAAVPANLYAEFNSQYLLPNQIQAIKLRLAYPKTKVQKANVEIYY